MKDVPRPGTALITGASGGIGLELARLFARDGWNLVLVARRESELKKLAAELQSGSSIEVRVLAKDLGESGTARQIFEELQRAGVTVDVLVNNAGVGTFGPFLAGDLKSDVAMMQLNMIALIELTRLFGAAMKERGHGRILNVASTASFQPGPLMAIYYATKAFVLYFSEALAEELSGSGVKVTTLCPGPTRTGFQARAKMDESRLFSGLLKIHDAATAARVGYRGLLKGRRIVIPGLLNRLLVQSMRITPRRVATKIVHLLQQEK